MRGSGGQVLRMQTILNQVRAGVAGAGQIPMPCADWPHTLCACELGRFLLIVASQSRHGLCTSCSARPI
jgi:hypothetical protein